MAVIPRKDITSLRIRKTTKKRFKTYGKYGEDADAILNKIMDMADDFKVEKEGG